LKIKQPMLTFSRNNRRRHTYHAQKFIVICWQWNFVTFKNIWVVHVSISQRWWPCMLAAFWLTAY